MISQDSRCKHTTQNTLTAASEHDKERGLFFEEGEDMAGSETPPALVRAAARPDPVGCDTALLYNANADVRGEYMETGLHWAAMNGDMLVVTKLLAKGADATLTDVNGNRPETLARKYGHQEVAEVLRGAVRARGTNAWER